MGLGGGVAPSPKGWGGPPQALRGLGVGCYAQGPKPMGGPPQALRGLGVGCFAGRPKKGTQKIAQNRSKPDTIFVDSVRNQHPLL